MEPPRLLQRISESFPEEPLPEMTLRQAQLADQSLSKKISDAEWEAEGARDRGLSWSQVADEQLVECEAAISHLDEESFVYYLPAFLRFAVRHVDVGISGENGILMNSILFGVTNLSNYNLGRLKRLNEGQIACVTEFLQFFAERSECYGSDASEALKHYWLTPDAHRKTIIQLYEP
jgi:hypothetical protein